MKTYTKVLIALIVLVSVVSLVLLMTGTIKIKSDSSGKQEDQSNTELSEMKLKLTQLENQVEEEKIQESILKYQNDFINATFEIDSVSQRNKQMRPFIDPDSIDRLGLNTDPPETVSIRSEVLESRTYYRKASEKQREALSRVTVRYDKNDRMDKNLIFSVEYKQNNKGEWKVTNIRYAEDFENN